MSVFKEGNWGSPEMSRSKLSKGNGEPPPPPQQRGGSIPDRRNSSVVAGGHGNGELSEVSEMNSGLCG